MLCNNVKSSSFNTAAMRTRFYHELPILLHDGPSKIWKRRFVGVCGKNKTARISSSDTGHPNMSRSQSLFRDLPSLKTKLESELRQNPPDLRSLFYIYETATLWTVALKRPILKWKKVFTNLSLGLF
jgi:hypothetical protein